MGFPTTRWSLILASAEQPAARAAWNELAIEYRSSIQAFFRCRFSREQADDLTQRFFADSIAGSWWARADSSRGSFRTYLRMMLRRFGARHIETVEAGEHDAAIIAATETADDGPDHAYDREFARTLIARALARLERETPGAAELWPFLLERGAAGELKQLAERLQIAHNTLLQRLRRLRMRARALIRDEFAQLVADPETLDAELAELHAAVLR